jgi:ABC-type antimicrobial peptide transport system permease subunit
MIRLILQSLRHYRRRHLGLALGVAVSTAVITGALIVGDSMRYSLERIAARRLGQITHAITASERYFTDSLALRLEEVLGVPCAPLLLLEGSAAVRGGQYRLPKVQVLGIDEHFRRTTGSADAPASIPAGQALVSQNLAARLHIEPGDELLLRIQKSSVVPLNAPFVSDAETIVPVTVVVAGVLEEENMGRFQLQHIQSAPFNVFISMDFLHEQMASPNKINCLLISAPGALPTNAVEEALEQSWTPADINLQLHYDSLRNTWNLASERVFIDPAIQEALQRDSTPKEIVLTYFANRLAGRSRETPYSFVSTLPENELQPGEIILNQWLADDLHAQTGDSIRLDYFAIGPLRELEERSASFLATAIVPMTERWTDLNLMPQIPGLSDAGSCRDWKTGIPVDLEKIRKKDEDYWDRYRGAPKAYISYADGRRLWQNRFGAATLIRFSTQNEGQNGLEALIKRQISPFDLGFRVEPIRAEADLAARSGVDFSQLFLGLSFFLVLASLLLTVLLFNLHTESRMDQIGTLSVLGFTRRQIRTMILLESGAVAVLGSTVGLVLAIVYNQAIFSALNHIWSAIVRTQTLAVSIQPWTLATGFGISLSVSVPVIYFSLNRLLRQQAHSLQSGTARSGQRWVQWLKRTIMVACGATAILLVGWSLAQGAINDAGSFFAAGGLLLTGLLLWIHSRLREPPTPSADVQMSLSRLVRQNIRRNRNRSFLVIALFATGTFIVVATGVHRRDAFSTASEKDSGTGGFLFFAESTIPVRRDLNDPAVRFEAGLEGKYPVVQLRAFRGDDASCLNLNRVATPSIWGVQPGALSGRFRFVSRTEELDEARPWLSLQKSLDEQTIPAIADQTVIQWGLGLTIGDTLQYLDEHGRTLNLKLIGGLSNSIFQGSVLIDNRLFLKHFPGSSGSNVFLIDGDPAEAESIRAEMESSFRDHGWLMISAAERLSAFNSVENTYLSIFMILGGLGLLLGTIGLGIVLTRNLLGRRDELALMAALGFRKSGIQRMITREHIYLLSIGVGIGALSSTVAALPVWLNPNIEVSPWSVLLLIAALFLFGLWWIVLFARRFLKSFYFSEEEGERSGAIIKKRT